QVSASFLRCGISPTRGRQRVASPRNTRQSGTRQTMHGGAMRKTASDKNHPIAKAGGFKPH
ncbi:MAG: hypothetical protein WBV61_12545, partial [Rhodanobacteraceae bacterium]